MGEGLRHYLTPSIRIALKERGPRMPFKARIRQAFQSEPNTAKALAASL